MLIKNYKNTNINNNSKFNNSAGIPDYSNIPVNEPNETNKFKKVLLISQKLYMENQV